MPTSQSNYDPAKDPCPTCAVIYPESHRKGCTHYVKPADPGQFAAEIPRALPSIQGVPVTIVRNDRQKILEAMEELARRDQMKRGEEARPDSEPKKEKGK